MTANASWPEHIQQQSAALCYSCFFPSYSLQLYLCTLACKVTYFVIQEASPWLAFYIHAFIGSKFCPSLIENISLRILCHNIRNFTLFSIAGTNCPSSRHATAANLVCNDKYICMYMCVCIYTHTHTHPEKNKNFQTDFTPVAGFIMVLIIYQNYDKISVIQFFVDYFPVFACVYFVIYVIIISF